MASRNDLEYLSEGQVLGSVDLTRDQAVALNASQLVNVQPSDDGWKVTAAFAVGAIDCAGLRVRVQPKVGSLQVLRLLGRAYGLTGLKIDDSLIGVDDDPDLTSVLALLFALEAAHALAPGPLRGYRTEEQTLPVLRGRLRLRDQELRRFGMLVPLEVTFDEWTIDTPENRRIRSAGRRLLNFPHVPKPAHDRLRWVDRLLADVTLTAPGIALGRWTSTRLNTRLHNLLGLADLVLAHATVEHRSGDTRIRGFVLSMPWLFERLITQLLDEAGAPRGIRVRKERHNLDQLARVYVEPDLVFTSNRRALAVADTKYKLLDDTGRFPNADAYQLVTYSARLGLDIGHLIYAAGEPRPEPYEILGADTRLVIHSIDLAQAVTDLEVEVQALFDTIVAGADHPTAARTSH